MLRKSWFYLSKTTHFVMPTKKQTRQRNARNRRNHHRKHHRKATCAKLFGAPVSTPISVPKSMQNRLNIDQVSIQIGPKSTSATNFGRLRPLRLRFSAIEQANRAASSLFGPASSLFGPSCSIPAARVAKIAKVARPPVAISLLICIFQNCINCSYI